MNTPRAARTNPGDRPRCALIRSATIDAGQKDAVTVLAQALGPGPFALVILFISPLADMAALIAGLDAVFPETPFMGCTTAGEIGRDGYAEGQIVAVALPSWRWCAAIAASRCSAWIIWCPQTAAWW